VSAPTLDIASDLQGLEDAIAVLTAELDQARADGDRFAARLDEHRVLLADALELRGALETRLAAAEREARLQRTTAEVRGRLVADIVDSRLWQRRRAIDRAARVERLISRG
jgi:hypothetical protein